MTRVLFWGALSLAGLLGGLVCVSPFVAGTEQAEGWWRVPELFARDGTVRQTALASTVGLVVAAVTFFRAPRRRAATRRSSRGGPRPGTPMGA
jgi:hypothetical protein